LTSSFVVPPTSGEKTRLLSPKMPWHDAHLASHTSMPWLTEPEPLGRPLKSGRTSMSQAAISWGVAARPMPVIAPDCAHELPARTKAANAKAGLRELSILHLCALPVAARGGRREAGRLRWVRTAAHS
jgi:hypothetical protein